MREKEIFFFFFGYCYFVYKAFSFDSHIFPQKFDGVLRLFINSLTCGVAEIKSLIFYFLFFLSSTQKYRLHTRRLPASSAAPANQSIVVLSGLWMSQDQYGDSSKASSSQSGSPQGPLQLTGTGGTSTTGCDSMEDDEDARSEGYSWKSHVHKPGNDDV